MDFNFFTSDRLRAAGLFAACKHMYQKRKYTFEPYVLHVFNVAKLVSSVTNDEDMIIAALLHDTVEDTDTTLDEIKNEFGTRVRDFVDGLTDLSQQEWDSSDKTRPNRKKRKAIDRIRLQYCCADTQTIKLADLIDNCKDIVQHDKSFYLVYSIEKRDLLEVLTKGDSRMRQLAIETLEKADASYKMSQGE